jgi:hypothetical protein
MLEKLPLWQQIVVLISFVVVWSWGYLVARRKGMHVHFGLPTDSYAGTTYDGRNRDPSEAIPAGRPMSSGGSS